MRTTARKKRSSYRTIEQIKKGSGIRTRDICYQYRRGKNMAYFETMYDHRKGSYKKYYRYIDSTIMTVNIRRKTDEEMAQFPEDENLSICEIEITLPKDMKYKNFKTLAQNLHVAIMHETNYEAECEIYRKGDKIYFISNKMEKGVRIKDKFKTDQCGNNYIVKFKDCDPEYAKTWVGHATSQW